MQALPLFVAVAWLALLRHSQVQSQLLWCLPVDDWDANSTYIPNRENCSTFYQCAQGTPVLMECPPSLHFNEELNVCDWPWRANCTELLPHTESTTAPEDNTGEETKPPVKFRKLQTPETSNSQSTVTTEEASKSTQEPVSRPTKSPAAESSEGSVTEHAEGPATEPATQHTAEPTAKPTARPSEESASESAVK
ncbi:unnamed protein product, partial [Ixodes hexagonus]